MAGLQNGAQTTNALGERIYETIATCKHFVGYSVDEMPPRLSFDPNVSDTDLWQYFFPAWEACAKSAVSVMCAYNGMNGYPMCMSPMIDDVLRAKFNFTARPENYVVTDSGGSAARPAIETLISEIKVLIKAILESKIQLVISIAVIWLVRSKIVLMIAVS